jgi:hypothetical protein
MGDPSNMVDDTSDAVMVGVGDPSATNDVALPPDISSGYAAPGSWSMYQYGADAQGNPLPPPGSAPAAAPATVAPSTTTKVAIGVGIAALVLAAIVVATPPRRRRR